MIEREQVGRYEPGKYVLLRSEAKQYLEKQSNPLVKKIGECYFVVITDDNGYSKQPFVFLEKALSFATEDRRDAKVEVLFYRDDRLWKLITGE